MTRVIVFPKELIGKRVVITSSTNQSLTGLSGIIVDETKSLLIISSEEGKTHRVLKNTITIKLEGELHLIPGVALSKRSEERIKG